MSHLPTLITDLALILGAAGITTLIFRRLKQPMVLGYILCGLLVSPHFPLFPTITDPEDIRIWAEIGVIFLLFSLGLEFSFSKLAHVGTSAGITGFFEITCMAIIGYTTGSMMGWPLMDCLFLGGIIAISSTTIIFRAFEELGLKTRQFTSLVMGVLIVEDLVAVLLMVLLSTLAVSKDAAGMEMIMALLKLVFFLCLWFLMGIFLLPTLLKRASRWMGSETLLIGAIGLCLGMVVLADKVGFSAALGAFVMGSILSETIYGEKIETLIVPVKNLFGAIFFVSVGMLIDPRLLLQFAGPVLLLTVLVILGKLLFVGAGALIAGRPLAQAVQAGTSMTQIGEFSFIIATLGVSLNVTGSYLYPIAVGVSVITTFTTPFLIRSAEPLYRLLRQYLPEKWLTNLDRYSAGSQILRAESDWNRLFGAYLRLVVLNSVIIVAILLVSRYFVKPMMLALFENDMLAAIIAVLLSLAAMMPFIWAMMARKIHSSAYRALWLDSKYNHGPLVTLEVFRNVLAVIFVGVLLRQFFPFWVSITGVSVVMTIVLVIFRQRLQQFYHRIEHRFISNLNEKDLQAGHVTTLAPWDAHLSRVRISPASAMVGKNLLELALREKYGINIAFIERGNRLIYAPGANEKLFPYDEIGVIGTDIQLNKFTLMVEGESDEPPVDLLADQISLQKIVVDASNGLTGKSIRSSSIRERTSGLVVGIERQGERILNPPSDMVFEWEDVVWLVGDRRLIDAIAHPEAYPPS